MNLIIAFLALATVTFIYWHIRDRIQHAGRNKLLRKLRKLSVCSLPFVGQSWYFHGSLERAFGILNDTLIKLETPFVAWIGNIATVHLAKLEDIEDVSRVCMSRNTYGLIEGTLEDGIIAQNHEKWRRTRRLMTPAFGIIMLTQYIQVFNEQGRILADLLEPKAVNENTFDLWPFLVNANIDIITENMMGLRPDSQRNQGNEYSEALIKVINVTFRRILNPLLHPNFVFRIYAHLTGISKHIERLHEYPRKVINESLENKADNLIEYRERTSLSSVQNIPKNMIDLLLTAHISDPCSMSQEQIKNEMIHLIAAGSETTAVGTAFLMLMLGMNQDIQEAVYQEISNVIRDDRQLTTDDVNELQYLEQCIKETLRIFNIVPFTYRSTLDPLTVSSGDTIPENVAVLLHLKRIHENAAYYPHPHKWNPQNFTSKAIDARPKNSFAPFGLGPRACLGVKYAMISMKVQAYYILRNYRVYTDVKFSEIELDQDILRRSRHGYPVRLKRRQM